MEIKNIVIFLCIICTSQINCQNYKKVHYSINDSFLYKRTIVNNYDESSLVDTIATIVKRVHYLSESKVLLMINNLLPLCSNDRSGDKILSCKTAYSNCLLIIDLKTDKIYKPELFASINDVELDNDFKKVSKKKYYLIDSIYSLENGSKNLLNGKEYNFEKVYFFPFVNYQYSVLYAENEDLEPGIFLWAKFPNLINQEGKIKTFCRYDQKQGRTNITLDDNLRVISYIYYPNNSNIYSYKFDLLKSARSSQK
jgi:hypothetical protein